MDEEGGFSVALFSLNGASSSSSSEDDSLISAPGIRFTLGYPNIIVVTLLLRTFWLPRSLTSTRMTRSRISSLTFSSILCSSLSSLFASTNMVLASGYRGNFHLHNLPPPFLQELLWPCQFVSSAILTASCPATPTQRVHVTKASVNISSALSSGTSKG